MNDALAFSFLFPFLFGLSATAVAITFALRFYSIKLEKPLWFTYNDYSLNVNFPDFENRPQKSTGPQIPDYSLVGESWLPEGVES